MHLLNVETLRLTQFLTEDTRPKYAILSHTWLSDDEEVTFDDLSRYHEALSRDEQAVADAIASRPGFKKILDCCNKAREPTVNLEWVWIDTICIDKRSSAELSEAINSMFKWYRMAEICFAFLQDVTATDPDDEGFKESRWFTRGWTLQELLAPRHLVFYNQQLLEIGAISHQDDTSNENQPDEQDQPTGQDRPEIGQDGHSQQNAPNEQDSQGQRDTQVHTSDQNDDHNILYGIISDITMIPIAFLKGKSLHYACVAKRFSWASRRKTKRPEDIAYCLLGIFDVNMPLLYGEGEKAFIRLQEHIIRQTYDDSILAWGNFPSPSLNPAHLSDPYMQDYIQRSAPVGALAMSPLSFKACGDFESGSSLFGTPRNNPEFQVTILGIRLEANLYRFSQLYQPILSQPLLQHFNCQYFCVCELSCFTARNGLQRIKIILAGVSFAESQFSKLTGITLSVRGQGRNRVAAGSQQGIRYPKGVCVYVI